jgi:predicted methyltransferase
MTNIRASFSKKKAAEWIFHGLKNEKAVGSQSAHGFWFRLFSAYLSPNGQTPTPKK